MSKSRARLTFLERFEPAPRFELAKLNALPFSFKSRLLKRQEYLNKIWPVVLEGAAGFGSWSPEHSCLRSPPPKILVRVSTWPWDESWWKWGLAAGTPQKKRIQVLTNQIPNGPTLICLGRGYVCLRRVLWFSVWPCGFKKISGNGPGKEWEPIHDACNKHSTGGGKESRAACMLQPNRNRNLVSRLPDYSNAVWCDAMLTAHGIDWMRILAVKYTERPKPCPKPHESKNVPQRLTFKSI